MRIRGEEAMAKDDAIRKIEKQVKQIDLRLKDVEAYIDAFDRHNQRIRQALEHWGK